MRMRKKEVKAVFLRRRGLRIREIAVILEVSERTVKRWLKKAREYPDAVVNHQVRALLSRQTVL